MTGYIDIKLLSGFLITDWSMSSLITEVEQYLLQWKATKTMPVFFLKLLSGFSFSFLRFKFELKCAHWSAVRQMFINEISSRMHSARFKFRPCELADLRVLMSMYHNWFEWSLVIFYIKNRSGLITLIRSTCTSGCSVLTWLLSPMQYCCTSYQLY